MNKCAQCDMFHDISYESLKNFAADLEIFETTGDSPWGNVKVAVIVAVTAEVMTFSCRQNMTMVVCDDDDDG